MIEQQSLPFPNPNVLPLQPLSQPHPQLLPQLLHKSLILEPPKVFLITLYLM